MVVVLSVIVVVVLCIEGIFVVVFCVATDVVVCNCPVATTGKVTVEIFIRVVVVGAIVTIEFIPCVLDWEFEPSTGNVFVEELLFEVVVAAF